MKSSSTNPRTGAAGCCGASAEPVTLETGSIKEEVKRYYGQAVEGRAGCCKSQNVPSTAQLAGYQPEVLAALPAQATEKSFGCGDPLAFAGVLPGQTVLDIGSGAGIDCFIAAEKVGPSGLVIGLDMTDQMIATARRNAADGGYSNVEFRQGDAENMPVDSATVDWVTSNCVINLSPDKAAVFGEIERILKPEGRFSISDIVAEGLPGWVKSDSSSYCGCVGGAIPEREYLSKLVQAGLVEVAIESRIDYTPEQIKGFILANDELERKFGAVVNAEPELLQSIKVSSVKFTGRKPRADEHFEVTLRPAKSDDLDLVKGLLLSSNLPVEGLNNALRHAFVATAGGYPVGVIAVERFQADGLVRSFAVARNWRGRGVGRMLWRQLLDWARAQNMRSFYLLTTTIAELAARAGFKTIERSSVPEPVRQSDEFTSGICDTAVTMRYDLQES